jgi:hypothetical protein
MNLDHAPPGPAQAWIDAENAKRVANRLMRHGFL